MMIVSLLSIPFLATIVALIVRRNKQWLEYITLIASVAEVVLAFFLAKKVLQFGIYQEYSFFSVDAFSVLFVLIITVIGMIVAAYSIGYLRQELEKKIISVDRIRIYYILYNLFVMVMLLAVTTVSPIVMWIAIEATTLSTAFLISFYNVPAATEAAWKYLIINSVGLLLAFLGTVFFLAPASSLAHDTFLSWNELAEMITRIDPRLLKVAFVFVLVGYGTKMGLVPMHTWRPDTYSKATTPVVALFSGVLLNVALFAILRFKSIMNIGVDSSFPEQALIAFGLLSIVLAALVMFAQKNYKKLLAYSSIEHAGLLALGFGFGGVAAVAALIHMMYHALAKSLLFFSAGNILLKYNSTKIQNVRGIISVLPITSVLCLIGFFAIVGMPPFGLFWTELYILSSGVIQHPVVVAIVVFSLAIIFIGFLRYLSAMMFGKPTEGIVKGESNAWTYIPAIILVVVLVVLGIYLPLPLRTLLREASVIIQ
ncbi:MAG TPA: proton-conducting transporter membrane subunit [Patescibacteria group bacterium]|nr:proton-conducting transporter membrane subunit [Patescibacteria group bacterium]